MNEIGWDHEKCLGAWLSFEIDNLLYALSISITWNCGWIFMMFITLFDYHRILVRSKESFPICHTHTANYTMLYLLKLIEHKFGIFYLHLVSFHDLNLTNQLWQMQMKPIQISTHPAQITAIFLIIPIENINWLLALSKQKQYRTYLLTIRDFSMRKLREFKRCVEYITTVKSWMKHTSNDTNENVRLFSHNGPD